MSISSNKSNDVKHLQEKLGDINKKGHNLTPESIQLSMLEKMLGNSNLEEQKISSNKSTISPYTYFNNMSHSKKEKTPQKMENLYKDASKILNSKDRKEIEILKQNLKNYKNEKLLKQNNFEKQIKNINNKEGHSTPDSIQSSMLKKMLGISNSKKQEEQEEEKIEDISPLTNESIEAMFKKKIRNKNTLVNKKNTNHPNNKNTRKKPIPNNKVIKRNTPQRINQIYNIKKNANHMNNRNTRRKIIPDNKVIKINTNHLNNKNTRKNPVPDNKVIKINKNHPNNKNTRKKTVPDNGVMKINTYQRKNKRPII